MEGYFKVGCKSLSALDGKIIVYLSVLLSVTPKYGYLLREWGDNLEIIFNINPIKQRDIARITSGVFVRRGT